MMTTKPCAGSFCDEVYAGAFSGLGSMLLDAEEIRNADAEELEEIARRYGLR